MRAYSGHSVNQSRMQQFTSDGNILSLVEKVSLRGDIAMMMWMLFLILSRY